MKTSIGYGSTAQQVLPHLPIKDEATLKKYVKFGYPVRVNGKVERIQFEGGVRVGNTYGFNLNLILDFLEKVSNKIWESKNERQRTRTAKPNLANIGSTSISSTMKSSQEQLMNRLRSQRCSQRAKGQRI